MQMQQYRSWPTLWRRYLFEIFQSPYFSSGRAVREGIFMHLGLAARFLSTALKLLHVLFPTLVPYLPRVNLHENAQRPLPRSPTEYLIYALTAG